MKNLGPDDDEDRFVFFKAIMSSFLLLIFIIFMLGIILYLKGVL